MTLVVDVSSLEVNGEDNDYYDDNYYAQAYAEAADNVNSELDNTNTGYITLQGVGILDIPGIELHVPIWETTNSDTLRYGVGHYVNSVNPGSVGNCTITGHHMLKYGSIFNRLEEVQIGDIINITDLRGHQYTYFVDELLVVSAEEMMNYVNGGITDTRQVTLITCVYTEQGKMRLLVIGHIQDGT
jgi:LPXTG-site transpeptidase (sortase) family protein